MLAWLIPMQLEAMRDEKQAPGWLEWPCLGQRQTVCQVLWDQGQYTHRQDIPRLASLPRQSVCHCVQRCGRCGETPSHRDIREQYTSSITSTQGGLYLGLGDIFLQSLFSSMKRNLDLLSVNSLSE